MTHETIPPFAFSDLAAHAPKAFDVLVVAGDVNTPGTSALAWLAERFPGVPLVYVLGNHDLYRSDDDDRYTYLDMYTRTSRRGAASACSSTARPCTPASGSSEARSGPT